MRDIPENKMAAPCARCGRTRSEYGCRRVPLGEFCLQWGLKYTPDALINPSPDPVVAKAESDPQVQAAAVVEQHATEKYEALTQQWTAALEEHSAAKLRADQSGRQGMYDPQTGTWHAAPGSRQLAARLIELRHRVDGLSRERESASEEMIRARIAHEEALENSYYRHGLVYSPWKSNQPTRTAHTF